MMFQADGDDQGPREEDHLHEHQRPGRGPRRFLHEPPRVRVRETDGQKNRGNLRRVQGKSSCPWHNRRCRTTMVTSPKGVTENRPIFENYLPISFTT